MNILFLGDVFGKTGRELVAGKLGSLKSEYRIDFTVANGENASHGKGLSMKAADEIYDSGIDFITMGNHTWSNSNIMHFIDDYPIVRPANFHSDLPGRGYEVRKTPKGKIGILNLQGRVYMEPSDNPFDCALRCVEKIREQTPVIIVDFHAEATSEKIALATMLDGKVSAVIGTHTHVQTADERILPRGTGFITDVGMCGPSNSIIGMDTALVTEKFIYNIPRRFEPAKGSPLLNGVVLEIDEGTGKTIKIERLLMKP